MLHLLMSAPDPEAVRAGIELAAVRQSPAPSGVLSSVGGADGAYLEFKTPWPAAR